jgi:phage terminase large subunit
LSAGAAGTGKSLSNLLSIYWACRKYRGARCLIVRKTRESLTETIFPDWENDVLRGESPVLFGASRRPLQRSHRQNYQFPNRSIVVLGGMDKPDKILSSKWDIIYCPEATELTETDRETLGGRLRNFVVPYQQLIADCNPTSPFHWLYLRCQRGQCTLISTTHQDNPRYWDRAKQDWTEEGRNYVCARLERMTGPRRARFLLGKWEAATGLVYEGFIAKPWNDQEQPGHLFPDGWPIPRDWKRVWGIDWGEIAPTVLTMCAVDPDCRVYQYREMYKTRLRPDELGRWAARELNTGREPEPFAIVGDHDPSMVKEFERGAAEEGRRLHVQQADKRDQKEGITAVQARFDLAPDGRARLFLKRDALEKPDPAIDTGPNCTIGEIVEYKYDENSIMDRPDPKAREHALDALRYVCLYVDKNIPIGGPKPFDYSGFTRLEGGEMRQRAR